MGTGLFIYTEQWPLNTQVIGISDWIPYKTIDSQGHRAKVIEFELIKAWGPSQ